MDSNVGIGPAIDGKPGWNFDVGTLELSHFFFPIGLLKIQEEGADDVGAIQRLTCDRFSTSVWEILRPGFGGASSSAWAHGGRPQRGPRPMPEALVAFPVQVLAGGFALSRVEAALAVLIKSRDQLGLAHKCKAAPSTWAKGRSAIETGRREI
jgi:hypothetical protein